MWLQLASLCAFLLLLLLRVQAGTKIGFYDKSCPSAQSLVESTLKSHLSSDPTIGAGILRLHFHDCFIRGCDASILIDGSSAEKTAPANAGLRGFEVVEDAKSRIEAVCPGVVSCADILTLAARDAVKEAGGIPWPVPLGRRDGRVSSAGDAASMPSFLDSVAALKKKFSDKGLSTLDMVTLSGAHTIGQTDCQFFSYRLYNYSNTGKADPSMGAATLARMQQLCPKGGPGTNRVPLDIGSQDAFDESYFKNLRSNAGILESDQRISEEGTSSILVRAFAGSLGLNGVTFKASFVKSMLSMSNIEVKTGSDGEIRRRCSAFN